VDTVQLAKGYLFATCPYNNYTSRAQTVRKLFNFLLFQASVKNIQGTEPCMHIPYHISSLHIRHVHAYEIILMLSAKLTGFHSYSVLRNIKAGSGA